MKIHGLKFGPSWTEALIHADALDDAGRVIEAEWMRTVGRVQEVLSRHWEQSGDLFSRTDLRTIHAHRRTFFLETEARDVNVSARFTLDGVEFILYRADETGHTYTRDGRRFRRVMAMGVKRESIRKHGIDHLRKTAVALLSGSDPRDAIPIPSRLIEVARSE